MLQFCERKCLIEGVGYRYCREKKIHFLNVVGKVKNKNEKQQISNTYPFLCCFGQKAQRDLFEGQKMYENWTGQIKRLTFPYSKYVSWATACAALMQHPNQTTEGFQTLIFHLPPPISIGFLYFIQIYTPNMKLDQTTAFLICQVDKRCQIKT